MNPRIEWLADKDGIGHAHVGRGRVIRAACGRPAIDPRHAWPRTSFHEACLDEVAKQLTADAGASARR